MNLSDQCRKFIEGFEGLYLHAYNDGAGVCTIGYGHTSAAGPPPVHYGMTITKDQADQILAEDMVAVEKDVERLVNVPLSQQQFDALVSFQFNTGALGKSTLLHLLNAGKYDTVPDELMLWVHGGGRVMLGLVRRRKAEGQIWEHGVYES